VTRAQKSRARVRIERFATAEGMGDDDIGGGIIGQARAAAKFVRTCQPVLFERRLFVAVVAVVAIAERAAELHFGEAEAVAQAIGGAREALEFFAAAGIEQVELRGA
jgi:hypothetical protein